MQGNEEIVRKVRDELGEKGRVDQNEGINRRKDGIGMIL